MSTTFVLHGGRTSIESEQNNQFFAKFTSLVNKDEVNVLMCYFSRDKSEWPGLFERDTKKVLANTTKKVNFYIPENPVDLKEKIDNYDVLFVSGGDAPPIEATYPDLAWLKEKLDGKVYLGSSMGAFAVATEYVLSFDEIDSKTVHHGIGILPINTLVHWDLEKNKEEKIQMLLKESNLPIITLNEGESVTIVN